MPMTANHTRQTQQQRRCRMRRRLMDATLDCLEDYGYHGASLSRILDRAGVSRGAWRHHYSSKKALIVSAARERLLAQAMEKAREMAPEVTGDADCLASVLDFIWESFYQGRYRNIWVELTLASRTDAQLRGSLIPVFRDFAAAMDGIWRAHFRTVTVEDAPVELLMNLTLYVVGGMGLQSILHDNPDYYRSLRGQWTKMLEPLVQVRTTGE